MTWSILARDAEGRFGIAIASRFFAVGALCAHTRRAVGALSTQALMNPLYGAKGIAALVAGKSANDVIQSLIADDTGRAHRQVHILPAVGPAAAYTGAECIAWCGHLQGEDFSVAGNMLVGPQVIEATASAYRAAAGQPIAERLLAAMHAGEQAGGDKRGKQAAALRIQADEDYLELDLRVDDHVEPLIELQRLYNKSLERFQPFVSALAGRHHPAGITDRSEIEARVVQFHAELAARNAKK
jgi:uncharacterized Ntn-hydrolase superfamily protein